MKQLINLHLGKNIFISLLFIGCIFTGRSQINWLKKAEKSFNIDSSIIYAEKHLAESEKKFDTTSFIQTSCYLSYLYNQKSRFAKSRKCLDNAIVLVKKKHLNTGLINLSYANLEKNEEHYSQALNHFLLAKTIFESKKDFTNLLKCYIDMGEFYRKLGKYTDALQYLNLAFDLFRKQNIADTILLIRANNRMAAVKNETAKGDSSVYYSNIALSLSRKIKNKNLEAISLNELGFSYKNMNKPELSAKFYEQAENAWFSIGADASAVHALYNRATLYDHNNYPNKEVLALYFRIIELVKSKGINYNLDQIFGTLSSKYLTMKDTGNAYKYFYKYHSEALKNIKDIYDKELYNIQEKYENAEIKKKITQVSNQLNVSKETIVKTKKEIMIILACLIILIILITYIIYLLIQRNKYNKTLLQKNSEKDILIQEIHHRVKNNLQFVGSLLNMQINSSTNETDTLSLIDATRRIRAVALVHEMLYNQNEINGVEIKKYLTELILSINDVVNTKNLPINFVVEADTIDFSAKNAIAIGMITSELISNSIKYAFKMQKSPEIKINLKQQPEYNTIIFTVKDNGTGFTHSPKNEDTLGLRLISIFSRQLKGEYTFENNDGLLYSLTFKNE